MDNPPGANVVARHKQRHGIQKLNGVDDGLTWLIAFNQVTEPTVTEW